MARPSFKPTPALRRKVAVCAGGGMSHQEIAAGLGISRPTLEKHFAKELSEGGYQKRQEVLDAMFKAATNGNVAAQKAYFALRVNPEEPAKGEGKKAAANADAAVAQTGTDWEGLLKAPSNARVQ